MAELEQPSVATAEEMCSMCRTEVGDRSIECGECGDVSCGGAGCGDWCGECGDWACSDCVEYGGEGGDEIGHASCLSAEREG